MAGAAYNDANFRALFTVFASQTTYPQATIQMYWTVATDYIDINGPWFNMLNGPSLQLAVDSLCAHLLTMFTADQNNVNEGEDPGQPGSIETSASVGSVSVSSLPPPVDNDPWRYWLNQTRYGQQLLALLAVKAVGGTYVGGVDERGSFRKGGGVWW
jgi:hypothetical protein